MDRPLAPFRQGRGQFYLGLAVGGALASLAASSILYSWIERDVAPERPAAVVAPLPLAEEAATARQAPDDAAKSFQEELGDEIQPKRLADAFEAATGHRTVFITHSESDSVRTVPLRIIQLPFGPALLTQDTNAGRQANMGAIGVHYLSVKDGRFEVIGSWPRAVMGWGWGDPPQWRFTDQFTTYPALYAWGDFTAQGAVLTSATITELRPEGPVTSDYIYTRYDNEGGQRTKDEPACSVKGRIANIRKDKSFDVVVTGSRAAIDRYEKGDAFGATRQIQWDLPCGHPNQSR